MSNSPRSWKPGYNWESVTHYRKCIRHVDESYKERVAASESLELGWELLATSGRDDKEAYKQAHQKWIDDIMSFWPQIREYISKLDPELDSD